MKTLLIFSVAALLLALLSAAGLAAYTTAEHRVQEGFLGNAFYAERIP